MVKVKHLSPETETLERVILLSLSSVRSTGGSMLCLLGAAAPTPEYGILRSIQFFFLYIFAPPWPKCLHPQPNWKEPTTPCNSAAQQPAASTHAARILAGRPIARSRLADASTTRLPSCGLLCCSSLCFLGFFKSDNRGWPSQLQAVLQQGAAQLPVPRQPGA